MYNHDLIAKFNSVLAEVANNYLVYTEKDLIKGKLNTANLRQVQIPVLRGGVLHYEKRWIDPNKENKAPSFSKEYKNFKNGEKYKEKTYTGTIRLDNPLYKKGDTVIFELNGKKVEGQFRHIAMGAKDSSPQALIRYEGKTYERKVISITNTIDRSTENPVVPTEPIKVGAKVSFSLREKDDKNSVKDLPATGTVIREVKNTVNGQIVRILTDEGKTYDRYIHNLGLEEASTANLTPEQIVLANKQLSSLKTHNEDLFNIIDVMERQNSPRKDVIVGKYRADITANNEKLRNTIDVLKGKRQFDEIVIPLQEKPVKEKPVKVVPVKEEPIKEPELDADQINKIRINTTIKRHEDEIRASKINILKESKNTDYSSLRNVYVSKKSLQQNMDALIAFKQEEKIPLNNEEQHYKNSPKEVLIKPEKPILEEALQAASNKLKTITTSTDKETAKVKQLTNLVDRAKKYLEAGALKDDTLVNKYEKELNKQKNKVETSAETEQSLSTDINRVANGGSKNIAKLNLNLRISTSNLPEEKKKQLRVAYSQAIRKMNEKQTQVKELITKALESLGFM